MFLAFFFTFQFIVYTLMVKWSGSEYCQETLLAQVLGTRGGIYTVEGSRWGRALGIHCCLWGGRKSFSAFHLTNTQILT